MRSLAASLGVRSGEGRLVGPLLLHSFLSGVSVVAFEAVANGLFLSRFPADKLPLAYVGAAVCVPLTGIAYERLQRRLPALRVFQVALGFLAAMPLAMALLVGHVDAAWPAFLLMSLSYVMWAVPALEFWGLAGRVLDLHQAKRLYGLVGTGEVAGMIAAGATVGVLLDHLGVAGVLALCALCALACLPLPGLLLARVADRPTEDDEADASGGDGDGKGGRLIDTLRAIGRDKYLLLLVAFDACYQLTHDALEYTSQVQVQAHFVGDSGAVTAFIGYQMAAQQVLVLLLRAGLSGRVLSRFGPGAGLMATPAVVVLGGLSVLAAAALSGGDAAPLFWPIIVLRMAEVGLLYGLGKPSVLVALRPLTPARRDRGQVLLETVVEPGATGLTGLNLLGINRLLGAAVGTLTRAMAFLSLVVATAVAWLATGALVRKAYKRVVRDGLEHGALQDVDLSHDPATIAALEERLLARRADDAEAALALVEPRLDDARTAALFLRLLPHAAPELRAAIYARAARRPLPPLRDALRARVDGEDTAALRAGALRALAAAAGRDRATVVRAHLAAAEPALAEAALATLLREADPAARAQLAAWADATDADRRLRAARALADAGARGHAAVIDRLLADRDVDVRAAALLAAAAAPDVDRWDAIAAALAQPTWRTAVRAFAGGGAEATRALIAIVERPDAGRMARTRAVRLLGGLPSTAAMAALWRAEHDGASWLRLEAVNVLDDVARVLPIDGALVEARLAAEARRVGALAAALVDLAALPTDAVLRRLLDGELRRSREILFGLLALAYDTRTVQRARHQIHRGLPDMRNLALEVLETMLSDRHRAEVLPALDGGDPAELLVRLPDGLREPARSHDARLAALADDDRPWIRTFARHARGQEDALHLVEKIIALQGVEFFASADEDLLAEIAASVVEQSLGPDTTIFAGGAVDASMYVVVRGRVRVSPAGLAPVELGAGAVFGELAALDPQPRSATVSTVTDTVLLRVSHSTVVDLMQEHIEIAHGIIRFLIRRYGRPAQAAAAGPVLEEERP